ncbi:30S ribosomal protein S8 [Candidatus Woesebacteria bacterium RIFCSPHIGHO2_01_FULL_38_9]|uniref:Small ribosomal subunit protein uS8 n=2 Tax=Candidatus Woeseibacteriota TaxID=1752722 RepID=A0A1F7Y3J2_9BACT|nr:MAG: 30S ribosomal protein S8 [Candidatus Woesebacteria bacterium RIFCSPHIGHO2_01_FULL_38_9]OGM58636.1 MAG: 30S ribosomal protein S8 [Candidatus Woesebacteria bacterium RIFCSPLOWO2_01_FULL_39_10]
MAKKVNKKVLYQGKVVGYPVGDFLIRVKNASLAMKKTIEVPSTNYIKNVAKALEREGYVNEVEEKVDKLALRLVYRSKEPVLTDIKLVSKPGLRVYINSDELGKRRGPTILIISTPQGVMSSKEALKKRLGGEVIAEIL